jgi:hypothetical protein
MALKRWLAVAVLCACGESGDDAAGMDGKWWAELANGCDEVFGIDGDRAEVDVICQLENGAYAVQAMVGSIDVTGDSYVFRVERSSCALADLPAGTSERASYKRTGDSLRISNDQGVLLLERLADGDSAPGSATAVYGCFSATGTFTPRAVQSL